MNYFRVYFKKNLTTILNSHPDLIFMQNEVRPHKKRELVMWLREKNYTIMM